MRPGAAALREEVGSLFLLSVVPSSVTPFLLQGQIPHVIHDGAHVFSLFVHVTGSRKEKREKVEKVAFPSCLLLTKNTS